MIADESTSAEPTCKNPFFKEPRYIGDIKSPLLATPLRAKRAIALAKMTVAKQRSTILKLQQTTRRLKKRITTLKGLVQHLKDKNLVTESAADDLMAQIPEPMQEILKRGGGSRQLYSPEIRAFALTLNFYSTKAYNYVRKSFNNLLPETSTIRKWYSVIDGSPGFTADVFESIKSKVTSSKQPILFNIVIDEISIRQRVSFDGKRYYGFVDLGVNSNTFTSDYPPQANSALFFMAVSINNNWKVPLGYFLINSLTGQERATLLERGLELLHETGAKVFSITFDGAKTMSQEYV